MGRESGRLLQSSPIPLLQLILIQKGVGTVRATSTPAAPPEQPALLTAAQLSALAKPELSSYDYKRFPAE